MRFFIACFFALLLCSCNDSKPNKLFNLLKGENTITTKEAYTEFVLDSNWVKAELEKDSGKTYNDAIWNFYSSRNFQAAWIQHDTLNLLATQFIAQFKSFSSLYGDTTLAVNAILKTEDSLLTNPNFLTTNAIEKSLFELNMTKSFYQYADKEYFGSDIAAKDLGWYIPRKKKDFSLLANAIANPTADFTQYEPVNRYYTVLKKALLQYKKIQAEGGFPAIDTTVRKLTVGDSLAIVVSLKKYLYKTGDLRIEDASAIVTDSLLTAIGYFQYRMGLPVSNNLSAATILAMNISVESRLETMLINMERLRWLPKEEPADYFLVNIPEYKLHVFENGKLAWDMNVVVGKSASRTVIFQNNLSLVVFSPYWYVPQSIIMKELLPKLRRNPGYLTRLNMEVLDGSKVISPYSVKWGKYKTGVPYRIREKPGPKNSLGLVKFLFPNEYNIYMHDSPAKSLFDRNDRAFSHGCIRLSEPAKLATYIFRNDSTINADTVNIWMNSGVEKTVKLAKPIPVVIGYFTAWVNAKGQLCFRKDIYELDQKMKEELFATQ